MLIEKIIIKKYSSLLAYDNRFIQMSKHDGRLKLLLIEYLDKENFLPKTTKDRILAYLSEKIIKTAKDLFSDEVVRLNKFYFQYQEKKNVLWGQEYSINELLLFRGFVISEDGTLDPKIHRSQDYKYLEYCKNNQDKLVDAISKNKSICGMSGPNDFLDSEITNFDKCPIPLKYLDPTISLLCKLLPMFNIRSVYSCGGHIQDQSCPQISFRDYEDFKKAKVLFEYLEQNKFKPDNFNIGFKYDSKNWMGKKVIFQMEKFEDQDYQATYLELFELSKALLADYLQNKQNINNLYN